MHYYIDLGSSTIKVYGYENNLTLLEEYSIYFKNSFDKVNDNYNNNTVEEMEQFVLDKLENIKLDQDYDGAIFTGGEERFELLTGFNLVENTLFNDNIHKYMVV